MAINEQFESLKNDFIKNTETLINTLRDVDINDLRNANTRGELALTQSRSSISFMALCKFVLEHSHNREIVES